MDETIERLIIFQRSGCEWCFNDLYMSFRPLILRIAAKYAEWSGIAFDEYDSGLSEEFWRICQQFDVTSNTNFAGFVHFRLNRKAIDISRGKERTYRKHHLLDDGAATPELKTEKDFIEMEVIKKFEERKTDEDKRQLINVLKELADDIYTTEIIDRFLEDPSQKFTAIGKQLGLHPQKTMRKIERFKKLYDPTRFGNIEAYLVVV